MFWSTTFCTEPSGLMINSSARPSNSPNRPATVIQRDDYNFITYIYSYRGTIFS